MKVPGRPEVRGREACGARLGSIQEYVVHGIRFKAEGLCTHGS